MSPTIRRLRRPLLATLVAAAAFYLVGIVLSDGKAVLERLTRLSPTTVLVCVLLPTAGFLIRFVRWNTYIHALHHAVPWREHLRIYLAGFALTATPGKVGENLRTLHLQPYGVPASHSVAAFFTERLADLAAMVCLSSLALRLAAAHSRWMVLAAALTLTVLLAVRDPRLPRILASRIRTEGWAAHSLRSLVGFLEAARQLLSLRLLAVGIVTALLAWGAEGVTFGLLARAMGIGVPIPTAIGVFAVATLLGAVSFIPGGVGPTEGVMVGLLVLAGASTPGAAAATLLTRAATLWWAVALGVLANVGVREPLKANAIMPRGRGS